MNQGRLVIYKGSQISLVVIFGFGLLELVMIYFGSVSQSPIFWIMTALIPIFIVLFYREQVEIDERALYVSYGVGIVKGEYDLNTINAVVLGPNSSVSSWLYDPFSLEVIIITLREGKKIALGSRDRQKLLRLLRSKVGDTIM